MKKINKESLKNSSMLLIIVASISLFLLIVFFSYSLFGNGKGTYSTDDSGGTGGGNCSIIRPENVTGYECPSGYEEEDTSFVPSCCPKDVKNSYGNAISGYDFDESSNLTKRCSFWEYVSNADGSYSKKYDSTQNVVAVNKVAVCSNADYKSSPISFENNEYCCPDNSYTVIALRDNTNDLVPSCVNKNSKCSNDGKCYERDSDGKHIWHQNTWVYSAGKFLSELTTEDECLAEDEKTFNARFYKNGGNFLNDALAASALHGGDYVLSTCKGKASCDVTISIKDDDIKREGYRFAGWTTSSEDKKCNNVKNHGDTITLTGSSLYYACWLDSTSTRTVYFNLNDDGAKFGNQFSGSNGYVSQTCLDRGSGCNLAINMVTDIEKAIVPASGKVFDGWSKNDETCSGSISSDEVNSKLYTYNVTWYACYKSAGSNGNYSLTIEPNGGSCKNNNCMYSYTISDSNKCQSISAINAKLNAKTENGVTCTLVNYTVKNNNRYINSCVDDKENGETLIANWNCSTGGGGGGSDPDPVDPTPGTTGCTYKIDSSSAYTFRNGYSGGWNTYTGDQYLNKDSSSSALSDSGGLKKYVKLNSGYCYVNDKQGRTMWNVTKNGTNYTYYTSLSSSASTYNGADCGVTVKPQVEKCSDEPETPETPTNNYKVKVYSTFGTLGSKTSREATVTPDSNGRIYFTSVLNKLGTSYAPKIDNESCSLDGWCLGRQCKTGVRDPEGQFKGSDGNMHNYYRSSYIDIAYDDTDGDKTFSIYANWKCSTTLHTSSGTEKEKTVTYHLVSSTDGAASDSTADFNVKNSRYTGFASGADSLTGCKFNNKWTLADNAVMNDTSKVYKVYIDKDVAGDDLYMVWDCSLTLDANGGKFKSNASNKVEYSNNHYDLSNFNGRVERTENGSKCTLNGWNTKASGDGKLFKSYINYATAAYKTLYANWDCKTPEPEPVTYSIMVYSNSEEGGKFTDGSTEKKLTYESPYYFARQEGDAADYKRINELVTNINKDCKLTGWDMVTAAGKTGKKYTVYITGKTVTEYGYTKMYANWDCGDEEVVENYSVTIDPNGGTMVSGKSKTVKYTSKNIPYNVGLFEDRVTRTACDLEGWYVGSKTSTTVLSIKDKDGLNKDHNGKTLYAKWKCTEPTQDVPFSDTINDNRCFEGTLLKITTCQPQSVSGAVCKISGGGTVLRSSLRPAKRCDGSSSGGEQDVPENPKTGVTTIVISWIVGLTALFVAVMYFKKNKIMSQ